VEYTGTRRQERFCVRIETLREYTGARRQERFCVRIYIFIELIIFNK
jgi:hypothetical protein